jgi:urease accessory protein
VELAGFIEASLGQFGHGSLPFMLAAHDEPGNLADLDQLCDCFTSNHVANRASRLQGQALLASAERIFNAPGLQNLRQSAGPSPCFHLAPVFGVVARSLGLGRRPAAELFCFLHLRGLTASAVRLGIVGPMEAQTIQFQSTAIAEDTLGRCQHLTVEDIAQTAPLLEIWQGGQDRLYSRLFQS